MTRRIAFGLVAAVLASALLAWLFRAPLSLGILQRVAERNLGGDPVASLEDGLHVLLCGAGSPLPDPLRSGAGLEARPIALDASSGSASVLERDGLAISMFGVDHAPVAPAVGYRFDYKGRSVALSGDTTPSQNLIRHARGVELLVHEALSPLIVGQLHAAADAAGRPLLAKILSDIPDYHTTPVAAAGIAQETGARHLLFYHVVPALPLPGLDAVFLEGVDDAYSGDVTLGRDGVFVSLPTGSRAINVSRR